MKDKTLCALADVERLRKFAALCVVLGACIAAPPDLQAAENDPRTCTGKTTDGDPLKRAGLTSCCVPSDDVPTMWPIPCDGSNGGAGKAGPAQPSGGAGGPPVGKCVAFSAEINAAAKKVGMDPTLLAAIAAQETGGPTSNSGRNIDGDCEPKEKGERAVCHGRGVFQIDDRSHQAFIATGGANDPARAAVYAAELFERFRVTRAGGSEDGALSAYNSGNPSRCGAQTRWPDGQVLCYAQSVRRHQAMIKALGPGCGVQ